MAVLTGINGSPVIPASPAQVSQAQRQGPGMTPSTVTPAIIDGTPIRVVVLALAAAAGLTALHMAGFRFNVGVSG